MFIFFSVSKTSSVTNLPLIPTEFIGNPTTLLAPVIQPSSAHVSNFQPNISSYISSFYINGSFMNLLPESPSKTMEHRSILSPTKTGKFINSSTARFGQLSIQVGINSTRTVVTTFKNEGLNLHNFSSTVSSRLLSISSGHLSLLPTMNKTKVNSTFLTRKITVSNHFVNLRNSTAVFVSQTLRPALPSTFSNDLSFSLTINKRDAISNLTTGTTSESSKFIDVGSFTVNISKTPTPLSPSISSDNLSLLSTINKTEVTSAFATKNISKSSKFTDAGDSTAVNVSHIWARASPSTFSNDLSVSLTINKTEAIENFSTRTISVSSEFIDGKDSSAVNVSHISARASYSTFSNDFSLSLTINKTEAIKNFPTRTNSGSSEFIDRKDSSAVNVSHSPTTSLPSISSDDLYLLSTINRTEVITAFATKNISESSKFIDMGNSTVNISHTPRPASPSTSNDDLSLLSTISKTEVILNFTTRTISRSSKFIDVKGSSTVNVSHTPIPSSPSISSDDLSLLSTINTTLVIANVTTRTISESSNFIHVDNSTVNISHTPTTSSPSISSDDLSLSLTVNKTRVISTFNTRNISESSKFIEVGSSTKNISNSPTPSPPSTSSNDPSLLLTIKKTEVISVFATKNISESSKFIDVGDSTANISHTRRPASPSISSDDISFLSTINKTDIISNYIARTISDTSKFIGVKDSLAVNVSHTLTTSSPSTSSDDLSMLLTINKTRVTSTFATRNTLESSKFNEVGDSTVNTSHYLRPTSSLIFSDDASLLSTINKTEVFSTFPRWNISESSKFIEVGDSSAVNISNIPTPSSPSTSSDDLSLLSTINITDVISTFATRNISESSKFTDAGDSTVNLSHTPTTSLPPISSDDLFLLSTINKTEEITTFATKNISESSKFIDVGDSTVNTSHSLRPTSSLIFSDDLSLFSTIIKTEVIFNFTTRTILGSSKFIGVTSSAVNVSYILARASPSTFSNNFSVSLTINRTEAIEKFPTRTISGSSKFIDRKDSSGVNVSHTPKTSLPPISSDDLSLLSTINKTEEITTFATKNISESSKFIDVGNSTVNISHTPRPVSPSTSNDYLPLLSTINKTDVILTFTTRTISESSNFIHVDNSTVSIFLTRTPSSPSISSNDLSVSLTINKTKVISTFATKNMSESSKFIHVGNSTVNIPHVPTTSSPSISSDDVSLLSTITKTEVFSPFATRNISESSKFIDVGYSSAVNISNIPIPSPPSISSDALSLLLTINKTRMVSNFATKNISESSKFTDVGNSIVNISHTLRPVLPFISSDDLSLLSTINKTGVILNFTTKTILGSSKFIDVKDFSAVNVSHTPTTLSPSISSDDLSLLSTINRTEVISTFATKNISESSKFIDVGDSTVNISLTPRPRPPSTSSDDLSLLSTINKTKVIANFITRTNSESSKFIDEDNSTVNISNTPRPASPSIPSDDLSLLLTINKTETISAFAIKNISESRKFIDVGDATVNISQTRRPASPSISSYDISFLSIMRKTDIISNYTSRTISETSKFFGVIDSSAVNASHISARASPSTFSNDFSVSLSIRKTEAIENFPTKTISGSSKIIDVKDSSAVNVSHTQTTSSPSISTGDLSLLSTIKRTEVISTFATKNISESSKFLDVGDSTVNISLTPTTSSPFIYSDDVSLLSTINKTEVIANFTITTISEPSNFIHVDNSTVNISHIQTAASFSISRDNFSLLSTMNKTEVTANFTSRTIFKSSEFIKVGDSSAVNISHTATPLSPSISSDDLPLLSTINKTEVFSTFATRNISESSKFVNVGNSTVNISITPMPTLPFHLHANFTTRTISGSSMFIDVKGSSALNISHTPTTSPSSVSSDDLSLLSIINKTKVMSTFATRNISESSKFIDIGYSSVVNISHNPRPSPPLISSDDLSLLSTINKTEVPAIFTTRTISESSKFVDVDNSTVNKSQTPRPASASTSSDDISFLPTMNKTEITSQFTTRTILESSTFTERGDSLAVNISHTLTSVSPFTSSDDLSLLSTINKTEVIVNFTTRAIPKSSKFIDVDNSKVNIFRTPRPASTSNPTDDLSLLSIFNKTKLISTFTTRNISESSKFIDMHITINRTEIISTFATRNISESSKFIDLDDSSDVDISHTSRSSSTLISSGDPSLLSTINKTEVIANFTTRTISEPSKSVDVDNSTVNIFLTPTLSSPSIPSDNPSFLSTINKTEVISTFATKNISESSKFTHVGNSTVNISLTPTPSSPSISSDDVSLLSTINKTEVIANFTTRTISEPSNFIHLDNSTLKIPHIQVAASSSISSDDFSLLSTMNKTEVTSNFTTRTILKSSEFIEVGESSAVNISHTAIPVLPSISSDNLSLLSTINKTKVISTFATKNISESSNFVDVGDSTVNISLTPTTSLPSIPSDNPSLLSTIKKTKVISTFATRNISESSNFLHARNSTVNISFAPTSSSPSISNDNFSLLSTINRTEVISTFAIRNMSESSKFVDVGNSTVNISHTPTPSSPSIFSDDVSLLSTINKTEVIANFTTRTISEPSNLIHVGNSTVNISPTSTSASPSMSSQGVSLLSTINNTEVIANSTTRIISEPSNFIHLDNSTLNIPHIQVAASSSISSDDFSLLSTMNKTKVTSNFRTILKSSEFIEVGDSSAVNISHTATPVLPSISSSDDLSLLSTIKKTEVFSTFATRTILESSKFVDVTDSTVNISLTPIPSSPLNHHKNFTTKSILQSSKFVDVGDSTVNISHILVPLPLSISSYDLSMLLTINKTRVISTFNTRNISESSKFIEVGSSTENISNSPTPSPPSTSNNDPSLLSTINKTEVILNFTTKTISGSSTLIVVNDSSAVNVLHTPTSSSPLISSDDLSLQATINKTEVIANFTTRTILESSKFINVDNSTVHKFHIPRPGSASISGDDISFLSTMNKTEITSHFTTRTISESSTFIDVDNSTVNILHTPRPVSTSNPTDDLSLLSIVNKTEVILTFATKNISESSNIIDAGDSSALNISHIPIPSPSSISSDDLSSSLTINKTDVISNFSTRTNLESKQFVDVGGSTVNPLQTRLTPLLFASNNFSLLSTTITTEGISVLPLTRVSASSQSVDIRDTSLSTTPILTSSSTSIGNLSLTTAVNKMETIATVPLDTIFTSIQFIGMRESSESIPYAPAHASISTWNNNLSNKNQTTESSTFTSTTIRGNNSLVNQALSSTREGLIVEHFSISTRSERNIAKSTIISFGTNTVNINRTSFQLSSTSIESTFTQPTRNIASTYIYALPTTTNATVPTTFHVLSPKVSTSMINSSLVKVPSLNSIDNSSERTVYATNTNVLGLTSPSAMNNNFSTSFMAEQTPAVTVIPRNIIIASSLTLGMTNSTENIFYTPFSTMIKSFSFLSNVTQAHGISNFAPSLFKSSSFSGQKISSIDKNDSSTGVLKNMSSTSNIDNETMKHTAPFRMSVKKTIMIRSISSDSTNLNGTSSTIRNLSTSIYPLLAQTSASLIKETFLSGSPVLQSTVRNTTVHLNKTRFFGYSSETVDSVNISSYRIIPIRVTSSTIGYSASYVFNNNITSSQASKMKNNNSTASSLISLTKFSSMTGEANSSPTFSNTHYESKNYSSTVIKTSEDLNQTISFAFRTTATISSFKISPHNSSAIENDKYMVTSIISTPLINTGYISTKAIKPSSVLSNTPISSTVNIPVALSKQRVVSCNATIMNREYTNPLSDSSSNEYEELATELKSSVSVTKIILLYGKSFRMKTN